MGFVIWELKQLIFVKTIYVVPTPNWILTLIVKVLALKVKKDKTTYLQSQLIFQKIQNKLKINFE